MKKSLVFLLSFIVLNKINSQTDTTVKEKATGNDYPPGITTYNTPVFTVKGDMLLNFPSSNFLDAVNGLFPWVFSHQPNANEFLYVINGFILPDINGISLQDIEEISFVRSGINVGAFPLSRPGTFYITLKKGSTAKPHLSFNSQFNFASINSYDVTRDFSPGFAQRTWTVEKQNGNWQAHHLAISGIEQKFNYYISLQQIIDKEPQEALFTANITGGNSDTAYTKRGNNNRNFRLLTSFRYAFSPSLSAEIFSHYSPVISRNKLDIIQLSNDLTGSNRQRQDYFSGGAAIKWSPVKAFRNELRFEFFNNDADNHFEYKGVLPPGNLFSAEDRRSGFGNRMQLHNKMLFTPYTGNKTKLTGGFDLRWFSFQSKTEEFNLYFINGLPQSTSFSRFYGKSNFASVSPHINFSFDDIISLYGRYVLRLESKTFKDLTDKSKSDFAAGSKIDFKKLLKVNKVISQLDINFSYAGFIQNNSTSYWLPDASYTNMGFSLPFPYVYDYNNQKIDLLKNKLLTLQATAGFLNNRLLIGMDWSTLTRNEIVPLPGPGGGIILVKRKNEISGIGLFSSFSIINKEKVQWTNRINICFPKNKPEFNSSLLNDQEKINMNIGLQTRLMVKRLSFQLNALASPGKEVVYSALNGTSLTKKINEWAVNYLSVAYAVLQQANKKPGLSVFLHARNLFTSEDADEYYRLQRNIGFGVNFTY